MTTETAPESGDTRFHVDVPNLFRPLPLAGDEAELDERLATVAGELMPDATDAWCRTWTDFGKTLVGALAQADTRYAGVCCVRDSDTGGVSPAALIVAVPQLSFDDPRVAAAGIAQVLGKQPGADARVLNLPCGPAAVVVRERRLRLPDPAAMGFRAAVAAGGAGETGPAGNGEQVLPVQEAKLCVPHKPWQRLVLIALSTPAIGDWEAYARIFVRIGMSLRFGAAAVPAAAR
ncbi:MAG: hypothetical protein GEV03_00240 [Streptosporangiales bacterium]|nr:hypothetical protein [Streptosporangiales bacterium]